MGKEDYTSTGGGLKLKGIRSGGIEKSKRKKKQQQQPRDISETSKSVVLSSETKKQERVEEGDEVYLNDAEKVEARKIEDQLARQETERESGSGSGSVSGKTEAEKRHEEMRRKRVSRGL